MFEISFLTAMTRRWFKSAHPPKHSFCSNLLLPLGREPEHLIPLVFCLPDCSSLSQLPSPYSTARKQKITPKLLSRNDCLREPTQLRITRQTISKQALPSNQRWQRYTTAHSFFIFFLTKYKRFLFILIISIFLNDGGEAVNERDSRDDTKLSAFRVLPIDSSSQDCRGSALRNLPQLLFLLGPVATENKYLEKDE